MKKIVATFLVISLLGGAFVCWQAITFLSTPAGAEKSDIVFEVPNGSSFYRVATQLYGKKIVSNADYFRWYAKLTGKDSRMQVGEYRLSTNMTPAEVLDIIVSGKSISYTVTIPEGHNVYEIRDTMNTVMQGRGDEFFNLVHNKEFIKKLTGEALPSMEGYIFPETYTFTKFTPIETLVRQMYDLFLDRINKANENPKIRMPLHEQVTLASVIEKETGDPSERQIISSVFHNRLKKGMKLQSDPTILYGMLVETGVITKNIKKSDILAPTPYNTYTVKALPVGPIANPGQEALWAAVNPVESNYLFFVSKNDGTHTFSETLGDHNASVKKFQLDSKMREGKSWRDLKKKNAGEKK